MCDSITCAGGGGQKRIHMSLFFHSERWSVKRPVLSFCMNLALEKDFWNISLSIWLALAVLFQNSVVEKNPNLLQWKFILLEWFCYWIYWSIYLISKLTQLIQVKPRRLSYRAVVVNRYHANKYWGCSFYLLAVAWSIYIMTSSLHCVPPTSLVS